jgi:MFS family permease
VHYAKSIIEPSINFSLRIETAFPPASAHGLGWGPVQTSSVLGANALVMFFLMIFVMYLSVNKVSDTLLVVIGFVIWMTGGALMYYLWTYQAKVWQFVLPILFTISGFPFIAPSNRSIFTQAVKSKPELEDVQSMMQAIMSMGASVGGFVAPSLVAIFVIRSPDEVEASPDQRELTPAAIYVPISCALCIFGLLYEWLFLNHDEKGADTEVSTLSETTCLIAGKRRSSVLEIGQEFSRTNEVSRRQSVELMGVPCPFESNKEKCHRDKLWDDKQEWEEIHRLGALDEYE